MTWPISQVPASRQCCDLHDSKQHQKQPVIKTAFVQYFVKCSVLIKTKFLSNTSAHATTKLTLWIFATCSNRTYLRSMSCLRAVSSICCRTLFDSFQASEPYWDINSRFTILHISNASIYILVFQKLYYHHVDFSQVKSSSRHLACITMSCANNDAVFMFLLI